MQLTRKIKLLPTAQQDKLLHSTMSEYIELVNAVVDYQDGQGKVLYLSSKDVRAKLPSCLKAQCCLDAKSIYKKYGKGAVKTLPTLRKLVAIWNNQNYKLYKDHIEVPVLIEGKSKRISIKCAMTDNQYDEFCKYKLGTLRITVMNNKLIAQIVIDVPTISAVNTDVMGVDLGIKVPAVCYTDNGKVKFVGNGRANKAMRRKYQTRRKKLGKLKKPAAIKKLKNKEQRVMKDIDHKLSRQIVNFALANHVATIKLESLDGIRASTRKSRKNNRSLSNWSFYRLASFIEYKAKLAGIQVEYVNPAYTSQICPICGAKNHAEDRNYICDCGFHTHRDIVGAINICNTTEAVGNRLLA